MSVNRRRVNDRPPRLYDLTGLQKDMSRMYGMTAARTLQALQHLYELKLATYPRTDSRYITHDDLETLHGAPRIRPSRPRVRHPRGHTRTRPRLGAGRQ